MMGAKVFNTAKGNHKYKNMEERKNPAVWGWNWIYQCEHIFRQLNLYIYRYIHTYCIWYVIYTGIHTYIHIHTYKQTSIS